MIAALGVILRRDLEDGTAASRFLAHSGLVSAPGLRRPIQVVGWVEDHARVGIRAVL